MTWIGRPHLRSAYCGPQMGAFGPIRIIGVAMFKRSLALFMLLASTAFGAPTQGKVVSVKGRIVVVEVQGTLAPWVKKGAQVKINQRLFGRVMAVGRASVTLSFPKRGELAKGATVTLASPKAKELKKGEKVTFDDSLDKGGC